MKGMVTPLPNFITKFMAVLAITLSKNKALLCLQRKAQRGTRMFFDATSLGTSYLE